MSETHVISALRAKRAEISGHVHDLEKRSKTWRARLAHIDAAIKIFSPDTDPDAIPPKKPYRRSRYFQRGEFSRLVQDGLREATAPVTTADLATGILAAKGLPVDAATLVHVNEKALGVLRGLLRRGTVSKLGTGRGTRWALKG